MEYLKNHFINKVAYKDIILVGSAPNFDGNFEYDDSKILVTVNGSSLGIKNKLVPDLCFFNTSVIGSKHAGKETATNLKNISAKHFVVVEGVPEYAKDWTRILTECNGQSFDFYSIEKRISFCASLLKVNSFRKIDEMPSTGFFALFLLLTSQVRSITLHGFSLIDGHSYLDNIYKRIHVSSDLKLIQIIMKNRYPVYGTITTEKLPIILSE